MSLDASGLSFTYPGAERKALDDLDFGIEEGEILIAFYALLLAVVGRFAVPWIPVAHLDLYLAPATRYRETASP